MAKKITHNAKGLGMIRKRLDGRWEARCTIGRDPGTGKQRTKSIYGKTQSVVRQKMQELSVSINAGNYSEPKKMKLNQWLDLWLKEYTGNLKEHTCVTYETQVRLHIKPALGAVTLNALKPHLIQSFVNALHKDIGLSPKTIKNVYGVLHRALDQAEIVGYSNQNPCIGIRLPRIENAEMYPFTETELKKFISLSEDNFLHDLFIVDMFTGMRQSEIMGLTWDCVDFENGTIYVDKQLIHEKKKGGIYKLAPPKNDKPRLITPATSIMHILQRIRKQQIETKFSLSDRWENALNLVFTNEFGGHLVHNTISHNFKRIVVKIGCGKCRFHDLRHTYAVNSIRAGDDIKTVQTNLGHATAAFTLDRYAHYTEDMRRESSARMQSFMVGLGL